MSSCNVAWQHIKELLENYLIICNTMLSRKKQFAVQSNAAVMVLLIRCLLLYPLSVGACFVMQYLVSF